MTDLDIAAIRARVTRWRALSADLASMGADPKNQTLDDMDALLARITELEHINSQLAEALAAGRKVKGQMP